MMSQFVVRRPRVIIAAVLALTAFLAFGLRNGLQLDVSPLGFVARDSQERRDFAEARTHFGADDFLLIAVVCSTEPGRQSIFTPSNLKRLRRLHEQIERTSGVAEVLSLVNVPYARSQGEEVSVESLIPNSLADDARLNEAQSVATSDRLFVGNLVSSDSKTAALNVLLKSDLPTTRRHEITKELFQLVRNSGFGESYFAGDPFSQWQGTEAIKKDLTLFLPLTITLIALLLWFCFRSFVAVVLPLVTIGLGLVWLLGIMAYFNAPFTILALMLPTLMLAIGCSYMIHVVNQIGIATCLFSDLDSIDSQTTSGLAKIENRRSNIVLESAMQFINLPVIVSALTIIAGFLSLAFTEVPAIRATAIYAAIGAAFTMILSLTFIPAVLAMMPARAMAFRVGLNGKMVRMLEDMGRWATSNQRLLYLFTAIIVVISIIGVRRIKIDIDYFHFSKSKSETAVGLAEINRRLSGAITFDIVIEGKQAGDVERSDVLRRIAELQSFAEQHKNSNGQGIDRSLSVVDFIKHLNRAFHENRFEYYAIPQDDRVISELLSDREPLKGFISEDGRVARVLIRSNLSGSQAMAGAVRDVENKGRELLPEFRVFATGTFVLLNRTSDQIAGEQIQSIAIALVTIFLMLALLFRSLRVGLTALVPNLIPVLFFFGFMGWQGIELNLTTSLVASVVLGLAVDNAVQFIVRFRRVQSADSPLREAIIESMRLSGRPIIYANIALAATFAIFAVSNFQPISSFGFLSAVTIIGCLVEDLLLLPSRLTSPVFRAR